MNSRKKIVAGNWKMNTLLPEAVKLASDITNSILSDSSIEVILCPPYPFVQAVGELLKENKHIKLGAQNCSYEEKGAYTGEVSAAMLRSCGCKYVIVGHSERRNYFNENNLVINKKIRRCLENELKAILCIGESKEERENQTHFNVCSEQLTGALTNVKEEELSDMIIAYEPVWAIGTGLTASKEQAQEMHQFIREEIQKLYGEKAANNIPILYGGSCNAENAKSLFACKDVDGGLIGGASLKANEFIQITQSF